MAKSSTNELTESKRIALTNRWKDLHSAAIGADRILGLFEISKEACNLLSSVGDSENAIRKAIRGIISSAVTKDSKTITEILRLSESFTDERIRKAQAQVQSDKKGISLTHLLTLTRVKDACAREDLLEQSLAEDWSIAQLRRQVKGQSKVKVSARPTQLTSAVLLKTNELIRLLDQIDEAFLCGLNDVKEDDRDDTREKMQNARNRLIDLGARFPDAIECLDRSLELIE